VIGTFPPKERIEKSLDDRSEPQETTAAPRGCVEDPEEDRRTMGVLAPRRSLWSIDSGLVIDGMVDHLSTLERIPVRAMTQAGR
jgi:hypothetical protein